MDQIFRALADPSRRQLLDQLYRNNGQTLTQLCRHLDMTREAVTKHLAVLGEGNLVVPLWSGREKRHYFNPAPFLQTSKWEGKFVEAGRRALIDLERALEQ